MKRFLITFFLVCMAKVGFAQTKWALIVGIGTYPMESGWSSIHGDNDIELVNSFLTKIGVQPECIITLKNEHATKQNIVSAFQQLLTLVSLNDWVYIHLSGHGQRITDVNGDEEFDSWDEAFIPYDAKKTYNTTYQGENHLVDDELNNWLMTIRQKIGQSGTLCVVLDACHSGDGSRYQDEETLEMDQECLRGTNDCFIIPTSTPLEPQSRLPIEWICLSACKDYENNYEWKVDNQYFGRLSYALSQVIRPHMSTEELIRALQIQYKLMPLTRNRIQTLSVDAPPRYIETPFAK